MKLMVLAGLALAVAVVAVGCSNSSSAPVPTGTPSSAAPPPRPSGAPTTVVGSVGSAGSDGLTVRYRDPKGGLKTVRVEDFRR